MYSLRPKINDSTLYELCTKVSIKLNHLFWDGGSSIHLYVHVYLFSEFFGTSKYDFTHVNSKTGAMEPELQTTTLLY